MGDLGDTIPGQGHALDNPFLSISTSWSCEDMSARIGTIETSLRRVLESQGFTIRRSWAKRFRPTFLGFIRFLRNFVLKIDNPIWALHLLIKAFDCTERLPSIVVNVLGCCDCIADFNWYCSAKIKENVDGPNYCLHLPIRNIICFLYWY